MRDLKNNIKFNYLYRDGGNYKTWNNEVFPNPQSLTLTEIDNGIRNELIGGEFFDPLKWKVKCLRHKDWIDELDHTWNEYDSVEFTDEPPTVHFSISDLLLIIKQN